MKLKAYKLLDANRRPYWSETPGALGGHRGLRGYGRLDCPSALRWIARGHYVQQRVFFADEATAVAAGYRPCARCLPERYRIWRRDPVAWQKFKARLLRSAHADSHERIAMRIL
ncbi:MAG: Ada metal-binding domain-containing protein [Candidatus Binataceae bacterium]